MALNYRPEIDGLRALAIGSVLIYHLNLQLGGQSLLPGGFLGVDVFFVISGYLIARIILTEALAGTFTYRNFYERRARRLLPSLLTVLVASAAVGWFVLHPGAMIDFAYSALGSIFFVSNIYWDLASQRYGAASGLFQPLLHTWSLAVEEQFYLLFPILVLVGVKYWPNRLLPISGAIVLGGLILAEILTRIDLSLSFYWLMSRIWEMMVGAVLAQWHMRDEARGVRLGDGLVPARLIGILPGLGLAMILLSLAIIKLTLHHPGIGTVPTVLGTALIIGFARPGEPVTRLFSSRPMVWVGLISYALYLWHYPIYAFGRLLRPDLTALDYIVWISLSVALAWLTYRFIEKPVRHMDFSRVWPRLGGGIAVVSVFAAVMLATGGLRERLPGLIALYGQNEFDKDTLARESWEPLAALAAAEGMAPSTPSNSSPFERDVLWFDPQGPDRRILVVGDSHSKDMFNVLAAAAEAGAPFQVARYGLTLPRVPDGLDALTASPNFQQADIVSFSYRYFPETLENLRPLIAATKEAGKQPVVFSNTVEFPDYADRGAFDLWLSEVGSLDIEGFNRRAWAARSDRPGEVNGLLRELGAELDVPVYDKADFICDPATELCSIVTPGGMKAFYDYGHYTLAGATYFGTRVADLGWFSGT